MNSAAKVGSFFQLCRVLRWTPRMEAMAETGWPAVSRVMAVSWRGVRGGGAEGDSLVEGVHSSAQLCTRELSGRAPLGNGRSDGASSSRGAELVMATGSTEADGIGD